MLYEQKTEPSPIGDGAQPVDVATQTEAADMLNVSLRTAQRARRVIDGYHHRNNIPAPTTSARPSSRSSGYDRTALLKAHPSHGNCYIFLSRPLPCSTKKGPTGAGPGEHLQGGRRANPGKWKCREPAQYLPTR